MNLVSIVPPPTEPGRPTLTQGTEVILADGSKMDGVTGITLKAEPNGVWKANIECVVNLKGAFDGIEVAELPTEQPITLQCQYPIKDKDVDRIKEFAEKAYPGRKVVVLPHDVKVVQPIKVEYDSGADEDRIRSIVRSAIEELDWGKYHRLFHGTR